MALEIIHANISHLEQVAFLFDNYRRWYHQEGDLSAAKVFLKERLEEKDSIIFLVMINGSPVGFTQLYPIFSSVKMGRAFLLNDMFVQENARKSGVATALLDAAKRHAIAHKAKFLLLQTSHDNFEAQQLYEKNTWHKQTDLLYQLDL